MRNCKKNMRIVRGSFRKLTSAVRHVVSFRRCVGLVVVCIIIRQTNIVKNTTKTD